MYHLSKAVLLHLNFRYSHVWRVIEDWKGGPETTNIEPYLSSIQYTRKYIASILVKNII